MKSEKQAIAFLLTLAMLLSCFLCVVSAENSQQANEEACVAQESPFEKGVFSPEFQETKASEYTAEDMVRAIILMDKEPLSDYEGTEAKRTTYGLKLAKEQDRIQRAMAELGVSYKLWYEYDTLLNGFSCDVSYGDLAKIAGIEGVSSVHIAKTIETPVVEKTRHISSNQTTGNQISHLNGYTGRGIVIAVLDTGINLSHEAFQMYDNMPITPVLTKEKIASRVSVDGYNEAENGTKVPFIFNYLDENDCKNVQDTNGHGTMAASLAAGYAENEAGEVVYCGSAPAAQLVIMKTATQTGHNGDADLKAMDDAYKLGVDVISYSAAGISGFTVTSDFKKEKIFKQIEEAGIIICASSGNSYNMGYYAPGGAIGTEYMDFGVVGTPAALEIDGFVSVASVNNARYHEYTISVGERKIPLLDYKEGGKYGWDNFAGKEEKFIVLKNADGTDLAYGSLADYEGVAVADKIVVISYGGNVSKSDKMKNAVRANAKGLIICNEENRIENMANVPSGRPVATIPYVAREMFLNAETDVLYTSAEKELVESVYEEALADSSSWGTSPMLTIDPVMASIGQKILSADTGGEDSYSLGYGTSAATPNLAGTLACVLQELNQSDQEQSMSKTARRDLALALLESTAVIQENGKGGFASVRQQGAGLANSQKAIAVHQKGAYCINPIQELGDDKDKTGIYSMELILVNDGTEPVVYDKLQSYVLYDMVEEKSPGVYINTQESSFLYDGEQGDAEVNYWVNGEKVTQLTVEGGQSLSVKVTIALEEKAKVFFDEHYPNGAFVEGYIGFGSSAPEGCEVHGTFLAFYGDWNQAPALEELNSFDYLEAINRVYSTPGSEMFTEAEADTAIRNMLMEDTFLYTEINQVFARKSDGTRGAYLGTHPLGDKTAEFMPEHTSFSTTSSNGSKFATNGMELDLYLLRNARNVKFTVSDKVSGAVYYVANKNYVTKSYLLGTRRTCTFSWNGRRNGSGAYLPSGTRAVVTIDIQLPYGEADNVWQRAWEFEVTVDYTAPVIESMVYDDENKTLTVRAKDENYLAGISICDSDNGTVYDQKAFSSHEKGASFEAVFYVGDIQKGRVNVVAVDYATNETEKETGIVEADFPATVTFCSPAGDTTINALTGEGVEFPEAENYEGYSFVGWAEEKVDKIWEKELPTYFSAGQTHFIREPETVFYALYAKGEIVESVFIREQSEEFIGEWALVGVFGNGDSAELRALGDTMESESGYIRTVEVDELENSSVLQKGQAFRTQNSNIIYKIDSYSAECYTVKNKATDKYLVFYGNRQLQLYSTLAAQCLWQIFRDEESGEVYVMNDVSINGMLGYHPEKGLFDVYTKGESEFNLYFYRYYDSKLVVDFYTSHPCKAENGGGHSYCYTDLGENHSASCVCGESYTEAHSYVNGRCLCGSLNLTVNHTLNLESDISINYVLIKKQLSDFDSFRLECTIPLYNGNEKIGNETVFIEPTERNGLYYFTLGNLSAVQMGDVVEARLHLTKDGEKTVFQAKPYSIAEYAYSVLSLNSADPQVKAVCANLLRFGARAQVFKGYRTDHLADREMTEEQKAYLTDLSAVTFENRKQELADCKAPAVQWFGVGLDLQSKTTVRFIVDGKNYEGAMEDLILRVSYTDVQGEPVTVELTDPVVYMEGTDRYAFDFSRLLAPELRSVITATVYLGEKQLSNTMHYSADTYGNNKKGELLEVCQALFAYSDSAKAYFG